MVCLLLKLIPFTLNHMKVNLYNLDYKYFLWQMRMKARGLQSVSSHAALPLVSCPALLFEGFEISILSGRGWGREG